MPEFHAEPYVYLAKLVEDHDLQWLHPPRCETIGCRSSPYGPATVEVRDSTGALVASALTNTCNHCAVSGLQPNTRYTYTVTVKHEHWGGGERWDWDPARQGLVQDGRAYRNEFRTLPDPTLSGGSSRSRRRSSARSMRAAPASS